jgi:hypothetical protein
VRQVEKERAVFVFVYESNRFFGVAFCESILVGWGFDDFFILHEWQRGISGLSSGAHVVAVRDTEIVVEAMAGWEERGLVTKVPFSDAACCVALFFQDFCNGDFVWVEALAVNGEEDALAVGVLVHIDAFGVAACHEGGAGGCADAAGDIKACEPGALLSHSVKVWSAVQFGAEAGEVAVAEVVAEDNDEVWFVGPARRRSTTGESRGGGTGSEEFYEPTACYFLFHGRCAGLSGILSGVF